MLRTKVFENPQGTKKNQEAKSKKKSKSKAEDDSLQKVKK